MSTELGRLGSYRVGDAERAHTVDLLKEAHVAGYLELAEMDERLSTALAARTRDDLERVLADLPPEWRARQGVRPPAATRRRSVPPPASRLLPVALMLLLVVAVVVLAVATRGLFFPWPLLWVWLAFGRRRRRPGWRQPDSHRVTWI